MKSKKAQGLSINVLIIALIALVVLAVVIFILFGGVSKFQTGLKDCKSKGGPDAHCEKLDKGCNEGEISFPGICEKGEVCCIPS